MKDALCVSMEVSEIYGHTNYEYVHAIEYCSKIMHAQRSMTLQSYDNAILLTDKTCGQFLKYFTIRLRFDDNLIFRTTLIINFIFVKCAVATFVTFVSIDIAGLFMLQLCFFFIGEQKSYRGYTIVRNLYHNSQAQIELQNRRYASDAING